MSEFSRWLDITMENKDVSGNELAKWLNVDISAVSRWRNGHNRPSMDHIYAIAKAFRVDPLRLASLSGHLPREMVAVKPLPIPEPKRRIERITEQLKGIRTLTEEQQKAMIDAYIKTIKEGK